MSNQYEEMKNYAAKYGQEHVLRFYNTLKESERELLLTSIRRTDFEAAVALYQKAEEAPAATGDICPAAAADKAKFTQDELARYSEIGLKIMAEGGYAAITMAGGQGTRLEFDGPKGIYDIGLPSHKSFFEIQLDTLKRMSRKIGKTIPWYIMTSRENNSAIEAFFEDHNWFGYPKEDIRFFQQGALPLVGFDGKVLMENPYTIKEGSDGNGSIFRALLQSGAAADLRKRGIKWFYVCNVDNVLANLADEIILGYAADEKAQCVSKSVIKSHPHEKVGVFCYRNGRPAVVEYSEISREMAEMTDENGELVYGDSHISCTLFHTDVLELDGVLHMPYHTARKKISYLDENGQKVIPAEVNAYKFEAFIFDAFQFVDSFRVFRIRREEEFAPVKNKSGEDSPETARKLYLDYYGEGGALDEEN